MEARDVGRPLYVSIVFAPDIVMHVSQVPSDGQWNMIDRKFYKAARIERWCVVIYERKQRFGEDKANFLVSEMSKACDSVGEYGAYIAIYNFLTAYKEWWWLKKSLWYSGTLS